MTCESANPTWKELRASEDRGLAAFQKVDRLQRWLRTEERKRKQGIGQADITRERVMDYALNVVPHQSAGEGTYEQRYTKYWKRYWDKLKK